MKTIIKYIFLFIIFLILFGALKELFEAIYFKYFEATFTKTLEKLNNPTINIDLLVIFYLLLWGWYFKKRLLNFYKPSNDVLFASFLLILIYSHYRWFSQIVDFIELNCCSNIYYSDILFIPCLIFFILGLFQCIPIRRSREGNILTFATDDPIENAEHDTFKRKEVAKDLASKIKSIDNKSSFAIAIIGPYGAGKTSFLNLIDKELSDGNIIKVSFRPWFCLDANDIINEFFKVLEAEVGEHIGLSHKLIQYGNKLSNIDNDNYWYKFFRNIVSIFKEDPPHQKLYDHNNKIFKNLKKKVVVFIDDVDRLNKNEVVEVVRLIRNTADFKKLVFIVAFDKEYVLKAIEEMNGHNHQFYLEKIFQVEIPVSVIDPDKLFAQFIDSILTICDTREFEIVKNGKSTNQLKEFITPTPLGEENYSNNTIQSIKPYFNSIINNKRDSLRYFNSITFDYPKVKSEVLIKDFFLIQLLKIKFYSIYQLLYDRKEILLEIEKNNSTVKGSYVFFNESSSQNDDTLLFNGILPLDRIKIEEVLTNMLIEGKIDMFENKIILRLLKTLFPDKDRAYSGEEFSKSVRFPENFTVYFSNQIFESSISFQEYDMMINEDIGHLKSRIDSITNSRRSWQLFKKLGDRKSFKTKEEFERINLIVFYAFQHSLNTPTYRILFNGLLDENIFKHWEYQLKQVYKGNEVAFRNYIDSLFSTHSFSPFVLVSGIVTQLIRNYLYNEGEFLLTLDELKEYNLKFLEKYLDQTADVDDNCFYLYRNCYEDIIGEQRIVKLIPKAGEMFKNHILKGYEESYIKRLIVPSYNSNSKHRFKVMLAFGEQPFEGYKNNEGKYDGFELFINESLKKYSDSEVVTNFKKFYDLYKANSYQAVEFGVEE